MADETIIDKAHAEMDASPDDAQARLRFYERLADAELFLLLAKEPQAGTDDVEPEIFEVEQAAFVLVFDREERLAQFAGKVAPYVALSGRALVSMIAGQGIGIGLNLDVAPSQTLLPAEAIDWLQDTLANTPGETTARIIEVQVPAGLPERLLEALDAKLATAMGLADSAYLAAAHYEGGARGHILAFVAAVPEAEPALARAVAEALTFSGIEAGALDVAFFRAGDPVVAHLDHVGLRFDLPQLQAPAPRAAPGSDPSMPPKLR